MENKKENWPVNIYSRWEWKMMNGVNFTKGIFCASLNMSRKERERRVLLTADSNEQEAL